MRTFRVKVFGRVQGVFFRKNVKEIADELCLKGGVKNCSDGCVEIIVEGSEEKLEEFILKIKESPGVSKVEELKVRKIVDGNFKSFEIVKEESFFRDKKNAVGNLGKRLFG
ncbi:MAG: acylphosphatase [Nanoarchaeota archaeon]|nr:acylphosphatase [Nanoarchaeota archaeon]MBU1103832.1 acylphosphatase [Nanoarchaeota archaeon]